MAILACGSLGASESSFLPIIPLSIIFGGPGTPSVSFFKTSDHPKIKVLNPKPLSLALCRYYSRMLALQIKAMEEGIMKYEDR